MDLEQNLRDYLVSELNTVANGLDEVSQNNITDGPYFFSAAYAAFARVLNIKYTREMGFLHFVMNGTHQTIAARVIALGAGAEPSIGVPIDLFKRLAVQTRELARRIERDEPFDDVLMQIVEVGYITTGNGSYLYRTGRISSTM